MKSGLSLLPPESQSLTRGGESKIFLDVMRTTITFCLLLTSVLSCFTCVAQQKKDTTLLTRDSLVGVWQRDTKRVGNGLWQNFRFYADNTFVLHFNNGTEDLRVIWGLKGRYRLIKDELYLTIVYRTVVDGGHIESSGSNEDYYNFMIAGGLVKDIREKEIKEMPDPLYVKQVEKGHIEIGNEDYYKISNEDMQSIEPGPPDSTALPALSYDSIETLVDRINKEVRQIDADSAAWRAVQDTKKNFRSDPAEVRKYYKSDKLCKMVTASSGMSLPTVTTYYFKNGMPLFIRGITKSSTHTFESRYYFQGPHLIKEVYDGHDVESRDFPGTEAFIQSELKRIQ